MNEIDETLNQSLLSRHTSEPKKSLLLMVGTLQNDFHRVAAIAYGEVHEGNILRMLVWTASSFVEGTISALCQILTDDKKVLRGLTQEQRLILKNQRLVESEVRPYFRPVEQKLESVLKIFATAYKPNWKLEEGAGKTHFSDFIKLRDRMTHPSSGSDLWCEKEDKTTLKEGMAWFDRQLAPLIH